MKLLLEVNEQLRSINTKIPHRILEYVSKNLRLFRGRRDLFAKSYRCMNSAATRATYKVSPTMRQL